MALQFLKKEINNKKRKNDEMLPPTPEKSAQWVTRGDLEKEREKAYLAEQAKIEEERRAVRSFGVHQIFVVVKLHSNPLFSIYTFSMEEIGQIGGD